MASECGNIGCGKRPRARGCSGMFVQGSATDLFSNLDDIEAVGTEGADGGLMDVPEQGVHHATTK